MKIATQVVDGESFYYMKGKLRTETGVLVKALRVMADLIEKEWSYDLTFYGESQAVVLQTLEGRVVGFIIYEDEFGARDISLGWVDPEYRNRGIYTFLYAKLVKSAMRVSGLNRIVRDVHVDNDATNHLVGTKFGANKLSDDGEFNHYETVLRP